jgi:hypothetical protein
MHILYWAKQAVPVAFLEKHWWRSNNKTAVLKPWVSSCQTSYTVASSSLVWSQSRNILWIHRVCDIAVSSCIYTYKGCALTRQKISWLGWYTAETTTNQPPSWIQLGSTDQMAESISWLITLLKQLHFNRLVDSTIFLVDPSWIS